MAVAWRVGDPPYATGTTALTATDAHGPPAIVLGPDRSLFLAGRRTDAGTGRVAVIIRKFTPGGFVDSSFGDAGVLAIPATVGSSRFGAFIVDGAGRLIVSYVDRTSAGLQPMLARYDGATGLLDPGYGNDGRIAVGNLVTGMALTADGDLLTVPSRRPVRLDGAVPGAPLQLGTGRGSSAPSGPRAESPRAERPPRRAAPAPSNRTVALMHVSCGREALLLFDVLPRHIWRSSPDA